MRILTAATVIGPLLLIGASPATAGQSIATGMPLHLAAAGDSATARDTYVQKARDAMHEWQQKLHDFSEKAKAEGQKEGNAAEVDLNLAWTKVKAESDRLVTASAEGWDSAK